MYARQFGSKERQFIVLLIAVHSCFVERLAYEYTASLSI